MARVAFIGLGTMGLPMARNLLAAGHEVVGCDIDVGRAEELGGMIARSPGDAAAEAEVVITSLPTPEAVEQVAVEIPADRAFVDMSTGPPELARQLAERFRSSLDAPVSGGPRGAKEATLTVMVGGDPEVFRRLEPLLRVLGRPSLVGGPGAGQTAKLCNNLIAGATMAAIAEGCAIAAREGIEARLLYELLSTSTADSRVLRTRFPLPGVDSSHPASNGYEPLFALDLIVKDLALALQLGDAPVAAAALESYRKARSAGHGRLDYSAVFLPLDT